MKVINYFIKIILNIFITIIISVSSQTLNFFINKYLYTKVFEGDALMFVFMTSPFFLMTLFTILYYVQFRKNTFRSMGFKNNNIFKNWLYGILLGFISLTFCTFIMYFTGNLEFESLNINKNSIFSFLVMFIFWTIQGSAEEILTRGFLFTELSKKTNLFLGIIVSSSLFSIMHLFNDFISFIPILNIFLIGLLFALLFIKYNNIWVICGFHTGWNAIQGNFFSFNVSGNNVYNSLIKINTTGSDIITGGGFGIEGGIIVSAVLTTWILYLIYELFIRKKISLFKTFTFED